MADSKDIVGYKPEAGSGIKPTQAVGVIERVGNVCSEIVTEDCDFSKPPVVNCNDPCSQANMCKDISALKVQVQQLFCEGVAVNDAVLAENIRTQVEELTKDLLANINQTESDLKILLSGSQADIRNATQQSAQAVLDAASAKNTAQTAVDSVTSLKNTVTDLNTRLSTLEGTVKGLTSKVDCIDGQYSTLNTTLTSLSQTVEALATRVSALENK